MDRGLWISWYDLPTAGRDAYLSWLHGEYIPRILQRPGILYAAHYESARVPPKYDHNTDDPSVPAGNDFVLIFGGESAHVFTRSAEGYVKGTPDKYYFQACLSENDKAMLQTRMGERVCVTTEQARTDGPAAKQRTGELALAPCIQLGSFNAQSVDVEDEWLAWFADWRLQALSKTPGCIGMRKLVSVRGWAKHLVLYEFESMQARNGYAPYLKKMYPEMVAWTERATMKLVHAPASPVVGARLWPPVRN